MGSGESYEPAFKKNVVLEAIEADRTDAEIAREHDIHPVTLSRWKRTLVQQLDGVFKSDEHDELERCRQKLESVRTEREALREAVAETMEISEKVAFVERYRDELGLNRSCALVDLPKSTYYYRTSDD